MIDWSHPIVIGLIIGLPSAFLGFLGYRRSVRVDQDAATALIIANRSEEVAQIIDGLNKLVENLQEDNAAQREENSRWRIVVADIEHKLTNVIVERNEARKERDECKAELIRLNQMLDEK